MASNGNLHTHMRFVIVGVLGVDAVSQKVGGHNLRSERGCRAWLEK